jgi:hypothetical protein
MVRNIQTYLGSERISCCGCGENICPGDSVCIEYDDTVGRVINVFCMHCSSDSECCEKSVLEGCQ